MEDIFKLFAHLFTVIIGMNQADCGAIGGIIPTTL